MDIVKGFIGIKILGAFLFLVLIAYMIVYEDEKQVDPVEIEVQQCDSLEYYKEANKKLKTSLDSIKITSNFLIRINDQIQRDNLELIEENQRLH